MPDFPNGFLWSRKKENYLSFHAAKISVMNYKFFSIVLMAIFFETLQGCGRHPYKQTNKVYKKQAKEYSKLLSRYPVRDSAGNQPYFVGTTNFSMRRPNYVIIHHTAQNSCDQTLQTFTQSRTPVSSHYVICKDGTVFHILNDLLRGHHAGVSARSRKTGITPARAHATQAIAAHGSFRARRPAGCVSGNPQRTRTGRPGGVSLHRHS